MKKILQASLKLAHIDASNILILGESGVGKGMLAKFIHKNSRRNKKPFIQINCAALPENLLEAELFGYEKGAFTGAKEQGKIGLFELAHEGTLFLDEIGDMPLILQAKILKYLDDQEIMPIGGVKVKKIDCLVIAATNQNLERSARNQSFRRDLFYRLNTFTLKIPPLRERPEDIFELTHYFLNQYNKKYHKKKQIQSAGINLLQDYAFPGNIRELENIIKKAVAIGENNILDDFFEENLVISNTKLDKLLLNRSHFDIAGKTLNLSEELQNFEKEIFKNLVSNCRSTQELANTLGISQPTAFRKMKKHNLSFIG